VSFEDLPVMPGDIDDVDRRLARARNQEWLACEGIYRPAGLGSGNVEGGHADAAVFGDAQDA
jgi:hypothetical protein